MGETTLLLPLFTLIAPFLLWPIEVLFPYPHIVEELVKTLLILYILREMGTSHRFVLTVLMGTLFAFSESVLYISNFLLVGSLSSFLVRLITTTSLHVLTSVVILLPGLKNQKLIVVGTLAAIFIHYFFNLLVG